MIASRSHYQKRRRIDRVLHSHWYNEMNDNVINTMMISIMTIHEKIIHKRQKYHTLSSFRFKYINAIMILFSLALICFVSTTSIVSILLLPSLSASSTILSTVILSKVKEEVTSDTFQSDTKENVGRYLTSIDDTVKLLIGDEDDDDIDTTTIWKIQLLERIRIIRKKCGILCHINSPTLYHKYQVSTIHDDDHNNKSNWDMIQIPEWYEPISTVRHRRTSSSNHMNSQQCIQFIDMDEMDALDNTSPKHIPSELMPFFTMHGFVTVTNASSSSKDVRSVLNQAKTFDSKSTNIIRWNTTYIEDSITQIKNAATTTTNHLRDIIINGPVSISNQRRILVIGSSCCIENPWIELLLLSLGANNVTTLCEYTTTTTIIVDHPKLKIITPSEFRKQYYDGILEPFDLIIASHSSSVEYFGLGRYNDALNPWGDIIAIARAWCVTIPGGYMLLGVPTGTDSIEYNSHRVYGEHRLPLLTSNWIPIHSETILNAQHHVGIELERLPTLINNSYPDSGNQLYWFQKPMQKIENTIEQ